MTLQFTVEEDISAHTKDTVGGPTAIAQCGLWRQANRRPAVADDQRRDCYLEAIEQVRLEKHRHRHAATLDEDAMTTARPQQARDLRDVETVRRVSDSDERRASEVAFAGRHHRASADIEGFCPVV